MAAGDEPIDWGIIAGALHKLIGDSKSFQQFIRNVERSEETEINEPELTFAPQNPMGVGPGGALIQYVSIVQSVNATAREIVVRPALASTNSNTPWAVDTNATTYTVKVPINASVPTVGDTVLVTFTGVTSQGAKYGLFGAGGGATQYKLKSLEPDFMVCRTLDSSGNEGAADVYVAKPYKLRKSPFHGLTVNGITYTYTTGNVYRTAATTTGSSEIQTIIPAYRTNADIVYGIAVQTNVPNSLGGFVGVIDINCDARMWASL